MWYEQAAITTDQRVTGELHHAPLEQIAAHIGVPTIHSRFQCLVRWLLSEVFARIQYASLDLANNMSC